MYIFYIDEAGCPGALPSSTSDIQPILVLTGLILKQDRLTALTSEFLALKRSFSPNVVLTHELDIARHEMKGSDLRKDIRKGNRNLRRHVHRFIDQNLVLLEQSDVRLLARVYIKKPGDSFNGKAVYTAAVQALCAGFQKFLEEVQDVGFVVADSRTPNLNSIVSHSIFTQKFQAKGDPYGRILEMPLFGHSENHAMLQIADFVSSTMLFPIASHVYCTGHIRSVHVHGKDQEIRERYALRLRAMAYRYKDGNKPRGGITIHDAITQRSQAAMFAGLLNPAPLPAIQIQDEAQPAELPG